jgi:hypothetical protein
MSPTWFLRVSDGNKSIIAERGSTLFAPARTSRFGHGLPRPVVRKLDPESWVVVRMVSFGDLYRVKPPVQSGAAPVKGVGWQEAGKRRSLDWQDTVGWGGGGRGDENKNKKSRASGAFQVLQFYGGSGYDDAAVALSLIGGRWVDVRCLIPNTLEGSIDEGHGRHSGYVVVRKVTAVARAERNDFLLAVTGCCVQSCELNREA